MAINIKENIPLAGHTTFKIGGNARYFCIVKNNKEIVDAIKKAKKLKLPFFILGGGSNLLVSDRGYKGLVIKTQNFHPPKFCEAKLVAGKKLKTIYAEAGTKLSDLVNDSAKRGLTGLEWAAGIPGTVGGAICGNVGWPSDKKNISALVKSVEVLDVGRGLKIRKFNLKNCHFGYRDSIFKHNKKLIILGAELKLKKGNKEKIKKEIIKILKTRKEKIPSQPSAGCIFKNPSPAQISKKFMAGKGFSAGELVDRCGLKGKKIGRAQISEKHANFIINLGGAKAKDVVELIKIIKRKVKNKFKIALEEEIQFLK